MPCARPLWLQQGSLVGQYQGGLARRRLGTCEWCRLENGKVKHVLPRCQDGEEIPWIHLSVASPPRHHSAKATTTCWSFSLIHTWLYIFPIAIALCELAPETNHTNHCQTTRRSKTAPTAPLWRLRKQQSKTHTKRLPTHLAIRLVRRRSQLRRQERKKG